MATVSRNPSKRARKGTHNPDAAEATEQLTTTVTAESSTSAAVVTVWEREKEAILALVQYVARHGLLGPCLILSMVWLFIWRIFLLLSPSFPPDISIHIYL